jgi:hypothetical protein
MAPEVSQVQAAAGRAAPGSRADANRAPERATELVVKEEELVISEAEADREGSRSPTVREGLRSKPLLKRGLLLSFPAAFC